MLIGSEIKELRPSEKAEYKPNLPPYTYACAITPFMCIIAKILKANGIADDVIQSTFKSIGVSDNPEQDAEAEKSGAGAFG
ncbi:MAG: hypothetical protein ACHQXK_05805, partial [Methanosarcina thermophila]